MIYPDRVFWEMLDKWTLEKEKELLCRKFACLLNKTKHFNHITYSYLDYHMKKGDQNRLIT